MTGDNLSNVTVNGELLEIPATIDVGGKSGIKYAIYNNQGGSMSPLYLP